MVSELFLQTFFLSTRFISISLQLAKKRSQQNDLVERIKPPVPERPKVTFKNLQTKDILDENVKEETMERKNVEDRKDEDCGSNKIKEIKIDLNDDETRALISDAPPSEMESPCLNVFRYEGDREEEESDDFNTSFLENEGQKGPVPSVMALPSISIAHFSKAKEHTIPESPRNTITIEKEETRALISDAPPSEMESPCLNVFRYEGDREEEESDDFNTSFLENEGQKGPVPSVMALPSISIAHFSKAKEHTIPESPRNTITIEKEETRALISDAPPSEMESPCLNVFRYEGDREEEESDDFNTSFLENEGQKGPVPSVMALPSISIAHFSKAKEHTIPESPRNAITIEKEEDTSEGKEDEEEVISGKEVLCYAWQIAKGMVRNFSTEGCLEQCGIANHKNLPLLSY